PRRIATVTTLGSRTHSSADALPSFVVLISRERLRRFLSRWGRKRPTRLRRFLSKGGRKRPQSHADYTGFRLSQATPHKGCCESPLVRAAIRPWGREASASLRGWLGRN